MSAKKGTILVASGDLDKAITAFEIACGFQAMGMEVSMWFVLYGTNCLRKPRSSWQFNKWFGKLPDGIGRNLKTDTPIQHVIRGLNHEGAGNLPLSQLNFFGFGPMLIKRVIRRKGMAQLEDLISSAEELGVKFNICQICVDVMAFSVPDDLIVNAEVKGVSSYYLEVSEAEYNITL